MSGFNKTQKILFEQLQRHTTHYIESEERGIVVDDLDVDGFIGECSKLVQANGATTGEKQCNLPVVMPRILHFIDENSNTVDLNASGVNAKLLRDGTFEYFISYGFAGRKELTPVYGHNG